MRQRPKPFTVEIKKSRKPGAEPQPLFGNMLEAQSGFADAPPPVTHDPLFGRPPLDAEAVALAGQVFGAAPVPRPETRILPDLTARPAAVDDEPARGRAERVKPSLKPKAVKPRPIPIEIVARAPAVRAAEPKPQAARVVRVRARRDDSDVLPRGERWKRRLSPYAR